MNALLLRIGLVAGLAHQPTSAVAGEARDRFVEAICQEEMAAGEVPGMAVTVVRGADTLVERGFGYADRDKGTKVDRDTAFELASASKALTGLAVLRLMQRYGLSFEDPVDRFVPWLDLRWEGRRVYPTLGDFVHQTSGVPERALLELSSRTGRGAIEDSVRALMPMALSHAPGTRFEYSSVNYDVLGLVIEAVSAQRFADFAASDVLGPAKLERTTVLGEGAAPRGMATGYKLAFWDPRPYVPPPFEGNAPAAYFASTAGDLSRWLKLQLGAAAVEPELASLVRRSHVASALARDDDGAYAVGWVLGDDGTIYHHGANPSFSSFVGFDEPSGYGVAVLANLNSEHTYHAGHRLLDELRGRRVAACSREDELTTVDGIASSLAVALLALTGVVIALGVLWLRGEGARRRSSARRLAVGAGLFAAYAGLVLEGPVVLSGIPWGAIRVWAPSSVVAAAAAAIALGVALLVMFSYATKTRRGAS